MIDGSPDDPRLNELADRALGESPSEPGDLDNPDYLTLALSAAATDLAVRSQNDAPLPDWLRAKVAARLSKTSARSPSSIHFTAWLDWVAAAACLMVAVFAWRGKLSQPPPSFEQKLAEMRASIRPISLAATDHPLAAGASGEMVWSEPGQQGFLTVQGLAVVDPNKGTYQLWIFDAERDARYPVDGGMFTVADASKPTIVPIHPTLRVSKPSLFAVTLEPPGGVVVSDRKRIMLAGSP